MSINCNSSEDCFESTSTPQNGIDGIGTWCFTAYAQNVIDNIPTGFAFERLNSECWTAQICKHTPSEPTPEEFASHWANVCHGLPLRIDADECPCNCTGSSTSEPSAHPSAWGRSLLNANSFGLQSPSSILGGTRRADVIWNKSGDTVFLNLYIHISSASSFNVNSVSDFFLILPAHLTASDYISGAIENGQMWQGSVSAEVVRPNGDKEFLSIPIAIDAGSNQIAFSRREYGSGTLSQSRTNTLGASVAIVIRGQIHYKLKL